MVINQAVVRKVCHHLKLTVFTNDCALTLKNVMLSFIVQITHNLILAALTILPFLDFSGEELIFSHAGSPTLKDQAVDTLHSVIQKHIQSPFPFTIGGGQNPPACFGFSLKPKTDWEVPLQSSRFYMEGVQPIVQSCSEYTSVQTRAFTAFLHCLINANTRKPCVFRVFCYYHVISRS